MDEIRLTDPDIGCEEIAAVTRVLESGWISIGPETAAFEAELATALGVDQAVAVSSGTAALHLAVLALGIGPGDEVVLPSMTFVATAAAVRMAGARPVFADVVGSADGVTVDMSIDPAAVAAALTPRTRAIIAVHYGGWPAPLPELRAITDRAGVGFIEDAAHAPVVPTPEGMLGTVGDVGCFSFHATKNLTTGEGGMVVARDPAVAERVRRLRSHAFTSRDRIRDVVDVGFNYRPTDLIAALGRVQLGRLDHDRAARRALTAEYSRLLTSLPVTPAYPAPVSPEPAPGTRAPRRASGASSYHLLPILLPEGADRDAIRWALGTAGVQTAVHYPPVHQFSAYRDLADPGQLPRTEAVAPRLVSLPLHRRMTSADVAAVIAALDRALGCRVEGRRAG